MQFQKLITIVENPDVCLGNPWYDASETFIISENFKVSSQNKKATHRKIWRATSRHLGEYGMTNMIYSYSFTAKYTNGDIDIDVNGIFREIDLDVDPRRSEFLDSGWLVGRIWKKEKIVSLWNYVREMDQRKFRRLVEYYPFIKENNYMIEFGDEETEVIHADIPSRNILKMHLYNMEGICAIGTYQQCEEYFFHGPEKRDEQKPPTRSIDIEKLHMVPPEKKGEAMKQKGIRPKTPINIADKMNALKGD